MAQGRCRPPRRGVSGTQPQRLTERTWAQRPGWFTKTAWIGTGVRDRDGANAEHIKLTLQRLKEKAEAG